MEKLKIAIQKKGRLHQNCIKMLQDCGIKLNNDKDQLRVRAQNFPLEVFYLRNSDIPQYVADGTVDIAIVGENTLIEKNKEVEVVRKMGFSKCRVSLALPKEEKYMGLDFFSGKKIATSYPVTLKNYLEKHHIQAELHSISGSVEIAPKLGLADAVCDIVSSGNTLFQNGLREVEVLLTSEAVLVCNMTLKKNKKELLEKLLFRINAVLRAKDRKYILLNVANENVEKVTQILPVLKSPTILPLAQKGWSSLHSVIEEKKFWEVIDLLKEAGAEDILIVPIDKMVL